MKFHLVQQRCVFLKGGPRMGLRRNQDRSPRSPPAVSSITEIQEHTTSEILTKICPEIWCRKKHFYETFVKKKARKGER
jgi:hypothetical protein